MRRLQAAALLVMAGLLFVPAIAEAENCDSLSARMNANEQTAFDLVSNNKGSAAVLIGCAGVGTGSYSQDHDSQKATAAFAGCAAVSCFLTESYGNCIGVNLKLFALVLRNLQLADERSQGSCPER